RGWAEPRPPFPGLCASAGAAAPEASLSIEPAVPVVQHGGSIRLACRTTCPDPAAKGNLETSSLKRNFQSGPGEMSVELINVTEWHSRRPRSRVPSPPGSPAGALEQPVLEPVPWMEEGASHNLTCKVPAVAPARNLTVTLGRGAETLRAGTFEHDADLSPHQVQVTQRITARRRHHGQNVTCQAELSLEPHGPRLSSAAAPAALAVYGEPLTSKPGREPRAVGCDASEPEWEPGLVGCSAGDPEREPHLACRWDGTTVLPPAAGFPDPYLAISEPNASLHEPVAVECSTAPSQPPGLQLWLRSSRGAQVSGTEGHVLLNLTAHEEDDGLEFVCEAELPVGNQTLQKKSAPAKLSVFYGPRMDEAGCPQQQTWTEGREAALRCSARGNPPPHVECARDGRPFPVAQPQPAARAHAGTYRCRAANRLGDAGRTVEVLVECECRRSPARRDVLGGMRRGCTRAGCTGAGCRWDALGRDVGEMHRGRMQVGCTGEGCNGLGCNGAGCTGVGCRWDALGKDAMGWDAVGWDAPGWDAPGRDAGGMCWGRM
uniref:Ig-like domain-containing protein n=1 Tax=Dromaius novaehollandiae TaxID=8790 RepID=A0A8C4J902_DRONO